MRTMQPLAEFHAWYFILWFSNRVVASVEVQLMLRSGSKSNDIIQFADALAAEGVLFVADCRPPNYIDIQH